MLRVLITGGAGFVGINTAVHYWKKGAEVTIFDNLSRKGTRINLEWLKKSYQHVNTLIHDIRDAEAVTKAVKNQDLIFHFAGQVAVTTSVVNPRKDFEINTLGTLNVLEAIRKHNPQAILVYSSTNKVYGDLSMQKIKESTTRYEFVNLPHGVSESELLDFHSPYGCSKGAADQYVRDYARIYSLKTIVFRQSCIYGPHQFGVEDQGWVAWFLAAAILNKPITIYGNGKQVRDLLYIDDLINAYELAIKHIQTTSGQIYNLGGGAKNTISIWKEFGPLVEKLIGHKIKVTYRPTRPGDQPIFISDTRKAQTDFCWRPITKLEPGITILYNWLITNYDSTRQTLS